jgi:hypothetical protein
VDAHSCERRPQWPGKRDPFLGSPETPASHQTIPLPQVVVDVLTRHLDQFPIRHPDRLLFTDDDGNALRRTGSPARSGAHPSRP